MTERQLIRDVRRKFEMKYRCLCHEHTGSWLCSYCEILDDIDDGLAQIGKAERLGPREDEPPAE